MTALAAGAASAARRVVDAAVTPACWGCGRVLSVIPPALPLCEECSVAAVRPQAPLCPCGVPVDGPGPCAACRRGAPAFRRARAAFVYAGPLPAILLRLKYSGAFESAPALGRIMAATAAIEGLAGADLVVPVPLAPARFASRGYNQAGLLAIAVGRALGIPVAPAALIRLREVASQGRRGRAERLERLRGAFEARGPVAGGRRVLLVDDVVTTGATAGDCARALKAAGAVDVDVLALARALTDV